MNNDRISEIRARYEAAIKHLAEHKAGNWEAHYARDMEHALAEIDRLTEALEAAKHGTVDCASAEHEVNGKCLGYGRSENDDEPCEQCAACPKCTAYEAETKTIQEWAALDGIVVLDPDGFDRSDPYVLEREVTKAEYLAGIWRCTIMPLPASPKGE